MPLGTSASADLEILLTDGVTWRPLMLARPHRRPRADGSIDTSIDTSQPVSLTDVMLTRNADRPFRKRLEEDYREDFSSGVGIPENGYNVAPGWYTRTPGYALPAGESTDVTIPATNNTATPITAIEEYGTDVWLSQAGLGVANQARVMRSVGGTGAFADSLLLGAVNSVEDLVVFEDGAGVPVLWASGNDGSGGRMHKWNGSAWTSTAAATFGANQRRRLGKVLWTTNDGISSPRMLATGAFGRTVAYTKPNADPLLAASWVEGVKLGTVLGANKPVTARRHAWFPAADGLFDLNELGDSVNLYPNAEQQQSPLGGYSSLYWNGYVYLSAGAALVRIAVSEEGILDENPGQCAPGWGTAAEHEFRGWITALCLDQGWLVCAVYNPSTQRTGIFWGQDRRIANVETRNPLVWHGPEVVGSANLLVTAMRPISRGGGLALWVAASAYNTSTLAFTGTPTLSKISLPVAGAPLDDLLSGGLHRFATGSGTGRWQATNELRLLRDGMGDRAAYHIIFQHEFMTRGLGGGTKFVLKSRADAAPGVTSWTTTDDVTVSPSVVVTPAVVVAGYQIERAISYVCASNTAVGVLDAVRFDAWKVSPAIGVRTIPVIYGDGVTNLYNAPLNESISPDRITEELTALTRAPKTLLRDRNGRRWSVKLEQVMERVEVHAETEPFGKTVTTTLEIDFLQSDV